jgi:hypothetical protein
MSALHRGAPTPFWRLLTLLVAVGQLLVVGASWIDTEAGGRDQKTHVEAGGTRLHYVHDDATCELCALQHLSGTPFDVRRPAAPHAPAAVSPPAPVHSPLPGGHSAATRSRAPPANA